MRIADWTLNGRAAAAVQVVGKNSTIPALLNPIIIIVVVVVHRACLE